MTGGVPTSFIPSGNSSLIINSSVRGIRRGESGIMELMWINIRGGQDHVRKVEE